MATIKLQDLWKHYGDVQAVRGINLDIGHNEFVALVGPSGCGKTTTLRMIAGLEDITGGLIEIGGRIVNEVPPKDRALQTAQDAYLRDYEPARLSQAAAWLRWPVLTRPLFSPTASLPPRARRLSQRNEGERTTLYQGL